MSETDKGRALTEQMFALIGRAITQWSFVEEQLCSIFMVCTGTVVADPDEGRGLDFSDCGVVHSAFFAVENLRSKLILLDAVIDATAPAYYDWSGEVRGEWAKLREKVRKLSLKRNKIAHCTVLPGYDYEGTIPPRLVPPIGSPNYYRATGLNPKRHVLSVEQVRHLERAFCLLAEKLHAFVYSLARNEGLFDRYVERVELRMDSYSRRDPKRAERLRRAQSSPR